MIDISDITLENIESGRLEECLPEIYGLREVFEHNSWHEETTFEHVSWFLGQYRDFLSAQAGGAIDSYLDGTVNVHAKKDLLRIVILMHDLGKKDTRTENEDMTTSFPGHEQVSRKRAGSLLDRFDLPDGEKEYVVRLIGMHSEPHDILGDEENLQQRVRDLKDKHGDIFTELMVLAMLDTKASKLSKKDPDKFKFRMGVYEAILGI